MWVNLAAGGTLAEISEGGVACEDDWMHASSCATTAGLESVRPTSADVSTGDGQGAGSNTKAPPASVIGMGVHGVSAQPYELGTAHTVLLRFSFAAAFTSKHSPSIQGWL